MNNKEFVNLLLKEIKEMSLICSSLSEVDEIPLSLLRLSKGKVDSMSDILESLMANSIPTDSVGENKAKNVTERRVDANEASSDSDSKNGSATITCLSTSNTVDLGTGRN